MSKSIPNFNGQDILREEYRVCLDDFGTVKPYVKTVVFSSCLFAH